MALAAECCINDKMRRLTRAAVATGVELGRIVIQKCYTWRRPAVFRFASSGLGSQRDQRRPVLHEFCRANL